MSLRVSPRFKTLLEAAASRENRSLTDTLESLVCACCDPHGIHANPSKAAARSRRTTG